MTGRITHVLEPAAVCERPGGCPDMPKAEAHRPGTVWTCDECGREWVVVEGAQYNESYRAWRRLTDRNRNGDDR